MSRTLAVALLVTASLAAACQSANGPDPAPVASRPTARILTVGDIMIGRRVGALATQSPAAVFEDIEHVVATADVALANLESPLTTRHHRSENPHALEADPAMAEVIAEAGFDVLGLANNHAGDAGPESVVDTIRSVEAAGMTTVGGGSDAAAAWQPAVIEANGIRIAMLAVDVSRQGMLAADGPGIAAWDHDRAKAAVAAAKATADVVVVGIHGGVDGWPGTDPELDPVAGELAAWGVDVVWGHGPHVPQPVTLLTGEGRPSLVATSLGNFLFDQQAAPYSTGLLLEALVDDSGLVAWRVGRVRNDDLRTHFEEWLVPDGNAALLGTQWWALARPVSATVEPATLGRFPYGDVVAAARGDVTGDGAAMILASYRHPFRPSSWDPRPLPVDGQGRSAHVGVFQPDGTPVWMSRRPPHPVGAVAACDGAVAFAYTSIDDPEVIATGAGTWNGFGFTLAPQLPGHGSVGCHDIDGDGRSDPVVVGRSAPQIPA